MGLGDRLDDAADTVASLVASVFLTTPDHPARGGNTGESPGLEDTQDDAEADTGGDAERDSDTSGDAERDSDTSGDAERDSDTGGDGDET